MNEIAPSLRRITHQCLEHVDELVARWADFLVPLPAYQEGLVKMASVISDCRLVFVRLLSDIGGHPIPVEARGVSERVGNSRALQGIPLAELMAAVRLDYRVMWEAIAEHIDEIDMKEVFDSVPRIWDAVERHSQELTNAYMTTQYGMAQVRQDERRLWFMRIQETDGTNHILNTRACRILGFTPDAHFAIFAHAERVDRSLESLYDSLKRQGIAAHHHETEAGPVVVAQIDSGASMLPDILRGELRVLVLDGIRGISSVPAAIRITQGLATVLPASDSHLIDVSDYWHISVFQNPFDTGRIVHQRHMNALLSLPFAERSLLQRTAKVFLSTGSIASTSRELFCHRNTISNRLDQFERVTGLDLRLPMEASLYVLARNAGRAEAN